MPATPSDQPGEQGDSEPGGLSGPGAGLSATGRHADDFDPGDPTPGTDYGNASGIGTDADVEDAAEGATA